MSLAIKYEGVDDARMRLRHTVVLYKRQPVYITEINQGTDDEIFRVYFNELPLVSGRRGRGLEDDEEGGNKRKFISSKHFDIAPFRMGYVNRPTNTGAFYCSRLPCRMQKQGLCEENFVGIDNFGGIVPFGTFYSCKETLAMVEGRYPSFDVALKALNKITAVAFSRDFCLVKDTVIPDLIYLYHKGNKVGMYNSGKTSLGADFKCLRESLNELGVRAA
jgi:hypothetical protein